LALAGHSPGMPRPSRNIAEDSGIWRNDLLFEWPILP
jgi:hypothetical protein